MKYEGNGEQIRSTKKSGVPQKCDAYNTNSPVGWIPECLQLSWPTKNVLHIMMGVGWNETKSAFIGRLFIFISMQWLLGQRRVRIALVKIDTRRWSTVVQNRYRTQNNHKSTIMKNQTNYAYYIYFECSHNSITNHTASSQMLRLDITCVTPSTVSTKTSQCKSSDLSGHTECKRHDWLMFLHQRLRRHEKTSWIPT